MKGRDNMAINNEELMQKFVRTGMIMRHIDGEGPRCHGKGHGHGMGHGGPGKEAGKCCHGHHGDNAERLEMDQDVQHQHGAYGHGHGPEGHPHFEGGHGHGKKCGKRRGQQRVIAMVAMKEGISQKDLAFLLGIRPQTLGELLRRLEERGLVERKKSETDGRVIEVYLTDEGRMRAEEIAERRKLAAADLFAVLTDEEKDQLASILDKLGTELDKYRPHHRHADEAGAHVAPAAPVSA